MSWSRPSWWKATCWPVGRSSISAQWVVAASIGLETWRLRAMARCCSSRWRQPDPCLRCRRRPLRPCMPKLMPRADCAAAHALWRTGPTVRCWCCLGWTQDGATKQPSVAAWPCCTSRLPPAPLVSAGTGTASLALGPQPGGWRDDWGSAFVRLRLRPQLELALDWGLVEADSTVALNPLMLRLAEHERASTCAWCMETSGPVMPRCWMTAVGS